MTFQQLLAWRDSEAAKSKEHTFMRKPESWYENPHWFCINGHVSGRFLKSDDGDRCLACHGRVVMGPAIGEHEFKEVIQSNDENDTGA